MTDALFGLQASNTRLVHIDSSQNLNFAEYWALWASQTNVAFASINTDGSVPGDLDLTQLIIDLLELI